MRECTAKDLNGMPAIKVPNSSVFPAPKACWNSPCVEPIYSFNPLPTDLLLRLMILGFV